MVVYNQPSSHPNTPRGFSGDTASSAIRREGFPPSHSIPRPTHAYGCPCCSGANPSGDAAATEPQNALPNAQWNVFDERAHPSSHQQNVPRHTLRRFYATLQRPVLYNSKDKKNPPPPATVSDLPLSARRGSSQLMVAVHRLERKARPATDDAPYIPWGPVQVQARYGSFEGVTSVQNADLPTADTPVAQYVWEERFDLPLQEMDTCMEFLIAKVGSTGSTEPYLLAGSVCTPKRSHCFDERIPVYPVGMHQLGAEDLREDDAIGYLVVSWTHETPSTAAAGQGNGSTNNVSVGASQPPREAMSLMVLRANDGERLEQPVLLQITFRRVDIYAGTTTIPAGQRQMHCLVRSVAEEQCAELVTLGRTETATDRPRAKRWARFEECPNPLRETSLSITSSRMIHLLVCTAPEEPSTGHEGSPRPVEEGASLSVQGAVTLDLGYLPSSGAATFLIEKVEDEEEKEEGEEDNDRDAKSSTANALRHLGEVVVEWRVESVVVPPPQEEIITEEQEEEEARQNADDEEETSEDGNSNNNNKEQQPQQDDASPLPLARELHFQDEPQSSSSAAKKEGASSPSPKRGEDGDRPPATYVGGYTPSWAGLGHGELDPSLLDHDVLSVIVVRGIDLRPNPGPETPENSLAVPTARVTIGEVHATTLPATRRAFSTSRDVGALLLTSPGAPPPRNGNVVWNQEMCFVVRDPQAFPRVADVTVADHGEVVSYGVFSYECVPSNDGSFCVVPLTAVSSARSTSSASPARHTPKSEVPKGDGPVGHLLIRWKYYAHDEAAARARRTREAGAQPPEEEPLQSESPRCTSPAKEEPVPEPVKPSVEREQERVQDEEEAEPTEEEEVQPTALEQQDDEPAEPKPPQFIFSIRKGADGVPQFRVLPRSQHVAEEMKRTDDFDTSPARGWSTPAEEGAPGPDGTTTSEGAANITPHTNGPQSSQNNNMYGSVISQWDHERSYGGQNLNDAGKRMQAAREQLQEELEVTFRSGRQRGLLRNLKPAWVQAPWYPPGESKDETHVPMSRRESERRQLDAIVELMLKQRALEMERSKSHSAAGAATAGTTDGRSVSNAQSAGGAPRD